MKIRIIRFLLIVLTVLLPGKLFSQGNHLVVPFAYSTIQTAINSSADGDTVTVFPGTYYENINFNGKKIVVGSLFLMLGDTSHISTTIINGDSNGTVVTFSNSEPSGSELNGFTITNGNAPKGGGILITNESSPALNNLVIHSNTASGFGGGIHISDHSNPNLNNIRLSENSAGRDGGGVYIFTYSKPALNDIIITDNTARQHGGGMMIIHRCSTAVNNVKISNNKAGEHGGGIAAARSKVILRNLEVTNNESEDNGPGIMIASNCKIDLYNITLCDNRYTGRSTRPAGGLFYYDSDVFITNSIIRRNEPFNIVSGTYNSVQTVFEIKNSNIGMDKISIDEFTTLMNTNSVIDRDPKFTNTGQFPYSLKSNSPCIDAGSPDTTGMGLPYADLAGNIRIRDGIPDMGAYEWDGISSAFPPIPPQWSVDTSAFQSSMRLKGHVIFNSSMLIDSLCYVGAFINGECRGTAGIKEIALWVTGIDMVIYGDNSGDKVSFKLWNNSYEEEFDLAETVTFTPGDSLGTYDQPVHLSYTFVTAIDDELKIPDTYQLHQNYPNPFNPETNINFALPKQERVRLVIYDILGRPVKTLADGIYAAGVHSLKWNGRNDAGEQAASGAYIYRIVTKSFTGSKKMLYMK